MEAQELRIGNWIADRGDKIWQISFWESRYKVSAQEPFLNTLGMELRGHPLTEYVDFLQPIPLNEIWLKTYGFDNSNQKRILETDLYLQWDSECKEVYLSTDIGEGKVTDPDAGVNGFKYVHQLQNLYFALTNQELVLS